MGSCQKRRDVLKIRPSAAGARLGASELVTLRPSLFPFGSLPNCSSSIKPTFSRRRAEVVRGPTGRLLDVGPGNEGRDRGRFACLLPFPRFGNSQISGALDREQTRIATSLPVT